MLVAKDWLRHSGQRIVARLREQTYSASLRQEVEFVERGEGDVLSRLSVDTSIVGERLLLLFLFLKWYLTVHFKQCHSKPFRRSPSHCNVYCWTWVPLSIPTQMALKSRPVGAMIYVSPTLTMLMLAVVPPVSLGAVGSLYTVSSPNQLITLTGFLRTLP